MFCSHSGRRQIRNPSEAAPPPLAKCSLAPGKAYSGRSAKGTFPETREQSAGWRGRSHDRIPHTDLEKGMMWYGTCPSKVLSSGGRQELKCVHTRTYAHTYGCTPRRRRAGRYFPATLALFNHLLLSPLANLPHLTTLVHHHHTITHLTTTAGKYYREWIWIRNTLKGI